jgi:hypothetical protein
VGQFVEEQRWGQQRGNWTRSLLRHIDQAHVAGHVHGARFRPLRPNDPAQFLWGFELWLENSR